MLQKEDILSIVQSGEGYNAEFKIRVPQKLKELSEEICAFSNAAGGVLLLGVDDKDVIRGVDINNAKRSAIQNSLNEINPHLPTKSYNVDVDGKNVWVIEVNSGSQKPYVLSGAIYVRQGPNTQKLTTVEQMRAFFQQSDRIYFDEAPCSGFNIDTDIDPEFFEEFRYESGLSKGVSREQIIYNLRLLTAEGHLKNGAALFFGAHPESLIETAVIRCIAFEGTSKTQIIDDKIFGGHLLGQYKQSMQWLKNKLNVRYEIEGGGARKEIWEIPETVFKEAIINALSHRDYYDKGARITVELFSDRVEISNPGGLTKAISSKDFGTKSHSRNPLIFGLFVRIAMVEQVGSGIGRMKALLKNAKLTEPIFKTEGFFTVVLKRETTTQETVQETVRKTVHETSKKILNALKNNPKISQSELAKIVGITISGVKYQIVKLKKEGRIAKEGSFKFGNWKFQKGTLYGKEISNKSPVNLQEISNKILEALKKDPKITRANLSKTIGISENSIKYQLDILKDDGVIAREGSFKTGNWVFLKRSSKSSKTSKKHPRNGQETSGRILKILKKNPKSNRRYIEKELGNVTAGSIKYHLNKLKKEGKIKRVGSTKSGYWFVL